MTAKTPPSTRRLFYGLPIPVGMRNLLGNIQKQMQVTDPPVHWQDKKLMHLTLVFLGEQPDEHLPVLTRIVEQAGQLLPPFRLALDAPGAFPSFANPRILWMGVEPSLVLMRLQQTLTAAVAAEGLRHDHGDFHPHITLGRCQHDLAGRDRDRVRNVLGLRPALSPDAGWAVDRIHLYESRRDEHGLHYSPIAGVMLTDRSA